METLRNLAARFHLETCTTAPKEGLYITVKLLLKASCAARQAKIIITTYTHSKVITNMSAVSKMAMVYGLM